MSIRTVLPPRMPSAQCHRLRCQAFGQLHHASVQALIAEAGGGRMVNNDEVAGNGMR